jgi:hypothetical protein
LTAVMIAIVEKIKAFFHDYLEKKNQLTYKKGFAKTAISPDAKY